MFAKKNIQKCAKRKKGKAGKLIEAGKLKPLVVLGMFIQHEWGSGPHGRMRDDVLCCSRPSFWRLYPSNSEIGLEIHGSEASESGCPLIWVFFWMMVLLMTPTAVELSVWTGEGGWGQPILIRVWRKGIIYLAVMKRAPSSDSAAEDMTNLMIWAMVRMAPLERGKGSFSDRKM